MTEYIDTVREALKMVLNDESMDIKQKFEFFWETRQSFGRSALLLSGGAGLGFFFSSLRFLLEIFPNNKVCIILES